MASTEDTSATTTAAAAAAANSANAGMVAMYAEAVEQYEASVAAASRTAEEGGPVPDKPSDAADPDKPTPRGGKSKPRGHVPWKLVKELPSPEGDANPWNRIPGKPVSRCESNVGSWR